jgi:hypothetical protein
VGLAVHTVAQVTRLYKRALLANSELDWRRFYLASFEGLCTAADSNAPRSVAAAKALISLLEDDLGATLVDAAEVRRLRRRLCDKKRAVTAEPAR